VRSAGEEGGVSVAGGAGEGERGATVRRTGVRAPKVRGCYARLVREWNKGEGVR